MRIEWYFDVISPFAWLQWPALRQLCAEHTVSLRPILLAGLLDRLGQLGPAEIAQKRRFTYRHALWRARQAGLALRFPPAHPFNPLPALRLCVAAGSTPSAIEAVLNWIWRDGKAADSADAIAALAAAHGLQAAAERCNEAAVKAELQANFAAACSAGVFGVPSLLIDGELFWGEDATLFARQYIANPALLDDPEYQRLDALPVGVQRKR